MTFGRALAYFTREAALGLLRSWKISAVAVGTIAVSLVLAGSFLLISGNLSKVVEGWRSESRIIVYFEPDIGAETVTRTRTVLEEPSWVSEVRTVTPEAARERFSTSFPTLSDLLEGWSGEPLPTSLEVSGTWALADRESLEAWLSLARSLPGVSMVDDDRDWLRQLETVALLLRALGLAVGGVLLLTAIFTIASVIRLTVYLYQDEISVMRLVGATEFFIRGPFYFEGLFQGILGGGIAVGALAAAHHMVVTRADGVLVSMVAADFLPPSRVLLLVALGALAGLIGAVVSLRREDLGASTTED